MELLIGFVASVLIGCLAMFLAVQSAHSHDKINRQKNKIITNYYELRHYGLHNRRQ